MSIHTIHPDVHENGLSDDCPRCEEHSKDPFFGLDNRMLADLSTRVVNLDMPRSENEGMAMNELREVMFHAEKLMSLGWEPRHILIEIVQKGTEDGA
jgi:hypothetical protein